MRRRVKAHVRRVHTSLRRADRMPALVRPWWAAARIGPVFLLRVGCPDRTCPDQPQMQVNGRWLPHLLAWHVLTGHVVRTRPTAKGDRRSAMRFRIAVFLGRWADCPF